MVRFVSLCRSESVRLRCSQQLSVRTPAGPAQCSPPSGTPSGHRSEKGKGSEVSIIEGERKRSPQLLGVAQQKKRKLLKVVSITLMAD